MAVTEYLNHLLETKKQIKEALESQGIPIWDDDTFRSYAEKIKSIEREMSLIKIRFADDETGLVTEKRTVLNYGHTYNTPAIKYEKNGQTYQSYGKLIEGIEEVNTEQPGEYIQKYSYSTSDTERSNILTVRVKVRNKIPVIRAKVGTSPLKQVLTNGRTYTKKLEVYISDAQSISIIFTDLNDESIKNTTTYDEVNGLILENGKYTITAVNEDEIYTINFIVQIPESGG